MVCLVRGRVKRPYNVNEKGAPVLLYTFYFRKVLLLLGLMIKLPLYALSTGCTSGSFGKRPGLLVYASYSIILRTIRMDYQVHQGCTPLGVFFNWICEQPPQEGS